jgi:hypothetical protein
MIGPLAPIIGAMLAAVIGAAVTYFLVVKRKTLGFWVTPAEDLSAGLRGHGRQIVVSVDGQGFLNLNRATVVVKNTGNESISGIRFDIEVPGEHRGYLADVIVDSVELRKEITIATDHPPLTNSPIFHVNVATFPNPKESFKIAVFYDGEVSNCVVRSRIADVRSRVKEGEPAQFSVLLYLTLQEARGPVLAAVGLLLAAVLSAVAGHDLPRVVRSLFSN